MFDEQPDGDPHGECAEEIDRLRDEVEYHKADAKKWALQAMKFDKWQPIETAPKDGTYILVGNRYGAWVATYLDRFQSGYTPQNPWSSMMLNHRHMERRDRQYSTFPTHWMPLPMIPLEANTDDEVEKWKDENL